MYCIKCGAPLPPDSQFCTSCGAQLENAPETLEPNIAPIAPPPMGQPFAEGPNVSPIAPPPMGQPFAYGQQPPKKKSQALLWALIGIGAALIVAAVLIFVVFAPGSNGPFKGNTVQTRFANDVVGVFTGAASGLETENDMKKIMDQPFELTMTTATDASGVQAESDITYAYDEKALGVNIASTITDSDALDSVKMLLLEDTLYVEQNNTVRGIRFESEADLSKEMSLKNRIAALFENSKLANIDYLQLTEMFINSIDESCFDKSAGNTTLTLDGKALSETLSTFADKLQDNKAMNDALNKMIEEMSGYPLELSSAISMIAPMLKDTDFELTFSVSYDAGRPAGLEIVLDSADSMVFDASFAYENQKDGKLLTLNVSTPDGPVMSMECDITKTADGMAFDGTITVPDSDTISFSGTEKIDKSSVSGIVNMTIGDQKITMNFDQSVKIGMPSEAVENDSRFAMDTNSAQIVNLNEIFGLGANQELPSLTN